MQKNYKKLFIKYMDEYYHLPERYPFRDNIEDFMNYVYLKEFNKIPVIKHYKSKHDVIYNDFGICTFDKFDINEFMKREFKKDDFAYRTVSKLISQTVYLGYQYFLFMNNLLAFIDDENNIVLCEAIAYLDVISIELISVNDNGSLPQWVIDSIEYVEPSKEIKFEYMSIDSRGDFITTDMTTQDFTNLDISANYNDDFPHEQILNAIRMDKAGIIALHGEPGTGKTTYIRHLMAILPEKKFIVMDQNMLANINNSEFIVTMYENKGAVIIIEDCEPLLRTRKDGNCGMSTLLNLTDGLLADAFGIKFICTYNADSTILDEALMRDGRLLFDYEFKKLSNDKAVRLCKNLNLSYIPTEAEPLSKIYNANVKNTITEKKSKKKVGF